MVDTKAQSHGQYTVSPFKRGKVMAGVDLAGVKVMEQVMGFHGLS